MVAKRYATVREGVFVGGSCVQYCAWHSSCHYRGAENYGTVAVVFFEVCGCVKTEASLAGSECLVRNELCIDSEHRHFWRVRCRAVKRGIKADWVK